MDNLRKKAKELLESKAVNVVIGYESVKKDKIRPVFITDPNETDKLIYNKDCYHNLALYVTKYEIKKYGKMAVMAPFYVMKSLLALANELQITDNDVLALGVDNEGKYVELADMAAVESYVNQHPVAYKPADQEMLDKISKMTVEERWQFWTKELEKCIKCYACRAACPMCYCHRCTVDSNQPQWITVPSHLLGNVEWHLMRAMHLAGRCINCGQCSEACPLSLPVNLLTLFVSDVINKNFEFSAGNSIKQTSALSTFSPTDKESFIV